MMNLIYGYNTNWENSLNVAIMIGYSF